MHTAQFRSYGVYLFSSHFPRFRFSFLRSPPPTTFVFFVRRTDVRRNSFNAFLIRYFNQRPRNQRDKCGSVSDDRRARAPVFSTRGDYVGQRCRGMTLPFIKMHRQMEHVRLRRRGKEGERGQRATVVGTSPPTRGEAWQKG